MIELTATELVCPAGRKSEPSITINMQAIFAAEARQEEVAYVTPQKAPELLREFNIAWRDLDKVIVRLSSEHLMAERQLEKRKAVLILDVVPVKLKERGLASNEANRDAVIALDEEYQALQDVVDQLDAVVHLLKGKLKAFENSFSSVKKIMGEDTYNMRGRQNPNLKGGADSQPTPSFVKPNQVATTSANRPVVSQAATTPQSTASARGGFGKARY